MVLSGWMNLYLVFYAFGPCSWARWRENFYCDGVSADGDVGRTFDFLVEEKPWVTGDEVLEL